MRIFVGELPKSCKECDLRAENDIGCGFCAVKEYYENTPEAYKTSPLQSLAELKKQIRNEVVQEIREQLKPHYGEEVAGVVLEDVLERIEGGENGR